MHAVYFCIWSCRLAQWYLTLAVTLHSRFMGHLPCQVIPWLRIRWGLGLRFLERKKTPLITRESCYVLY